MINEVKHKEDMIGKALHALQFLAGCCDWARTQDGAGFSSVDAPLGHALAGKTALSDREMIAAARLVVKYKKQLEQGAVDVAGVSETAGALECSDAGGACGRLRQRDVVKGWVGLDSAGQRIVLSTSYHDRIVAAAREMIGARYDPKTKNWSCDLAQENAMDVLALAVEFGLEVRKGRAWDALAPARKIAVEVDRIVIHGVNAGRVIRDLPRLSGKPRDDETLFGAMEWLSSTSIGIPLRSWVIRDATLWLETAELEGEVNARRLAWAKADLLRALEKHYPVAQERERLAFARAAAPSLPEAAIGTLRQALPDALAAALMPHQWVGVQAVAARRELLLCDEQGLGKTIEILAGLEAASAFPTVVLAPATALLNWRDEAACWLPRRRVAVLGGSVGKRDAGSDLAHADIVIINYESFAKHADTLAAIKPMAIVADEAQYLKGHDSQRTHAVKAFTRSLGAASRVICATGTPVMSRPAELLTLLTLTPGLLADLGGFARFASRYCEATEHTLGSGFFAKTHWDFGGSANLGELANRLREAGGIIRRSKSQVLPSLAPKVRGTVEVEISNRAEYDTARSDLGEWLKTHNHPRRPQSTKVKPVAGRPGDDDETALLHQLAEWYAWPQEECDQMRLDGDDRTEALRKLGVLRRMAGVGKIGAALRWIDAHVKDEKLVIFAYHIEVQRAILDALQSAGHRALSITGDMTVGARRSAILEFQTNPAAQIIVCSIKAAQTAITLTAARRVLMVELDWTPTVLEQAEDRAHRIGQASVVEITYLHAPNTLDDRMVGLLEAKRSKISVLNASRAPFGYRKDGQPRLRPAGPGRPRLDPALRAARRKASKAAWQQSHPEYMRDYMRERRREATIEAARRAIADLARLERMSRDAFIREVGDAKIGNEMHEEVMAEARRLAARARNRLVRLGVTAMGKAAASGNRGLAGQPQE